jgi:hypothetical protein
LGGSANRGGGRVQEEAVKLQAERRRLEMLKQSTAEERKQALETFNEELRDIQSDRDKHLQQHEEATRALLEERRRLNVEREAMSREHAAKDRCVVKPSSSVVSGAHVRKPHTHTQRERERERERERQSARRTGVLTR